MENPTKRQLSTQIFHKYTQMKLALSIRKRNYLHIAGKVARKRHLRQIKRWARDKMKTMIQTTLATVAWLCIALVLAGTAVSFQYLASALIAKDGFGDGLMYTCRRCNAMVHDVNGVYFSRHWFHITHRHWLRTGEPGCDHEWKKSGGGHADGALHRWYVPLLKGSHVLFACACGMAVTAILTMVIGATRGRRLTGPAEDLGT